jgi:hypothetical protein
MNFFSCASMSSETSTARYNGKGLAITKETREKDDLLANLKNQLREPLQLRGSKWAKRQKQSTLGELLDRNFERSPDSTGMTDRTASTLFDGKVWEKARRLSARLEVPCFQNCNLFGPREVISENINVTLTRPVLELATRFLLWRGLLEVFWRSAKVRGETKPG